MQRSGNKRPGTNSNSVINEYRYRNIKDEGLLKKIKKLISRPKKTRPNKVNKNKNTKNKNTKNKNTKK